MTPMQAALKGAGEIGFTIVSISFSLIAVFIPLLLMGGIVGRLFREFAVTVTMTIVVSALVSLTLTPMMCARLLKRRAHRRHGAALSRHRARLRRAAGAATSAALDIVLRHQCVTLLVFLATVAADRCALRRRSRRASSRSRTPASSSASPKARRTSPSQR